MGGIDDLRRGAAPNRDGPPPRVHRPPPRALTPEELAARQRENDEALARIEAAARAEAIEEAQRVRQALEAMPPQHRAFLERLQALCVEFGVSIDGCGCHGSPFVSWDNSDGTADVRENVRVVDGELHLDP